MAGPDGNLYFNCSSSLGQITTSGAARTFPNSFGITYLAEGIVKGPDGNPWFADTNGVFIGEFNPSNESFTNYVPPYSGGTVYNLALGRDNNLWSPESDNKINVYIVDTLTVSPASLTFSKVGDTSNLTIAEPKASKWTATSVSPGVCSVTAGSKANVFVTTAKGAGSTKITIKDPIGNSFVAPCKVT